MVNLWIDVARILVPIEWLAGMLFNLVLIYNLASSYIGKQGRLYYYSCIVTAVLSLYTSLGIFITINLAAIIDGKVVAMFYGPLLFYFPEWINNAIFVAFAAQVHTMWQSLPAPSILQWLALSKSRHSNYVKMLFAYSVPAAFHILAWFIVPSLIPSDEFRVELATSSNVSDFHVFGVRITDKSNLDGVDVVIFDLIPSFLVSYSIFVVGAFKKLSNLNLDPSQIRSKLLSIGASISERTKRMQFRFFLTQIAQVLLPLVLTSFPFGAFSVAALLGKDLRNFPFLLGIVMWSMPMLIALINLGFIRKTAIERASRQSKLSQSKNGQGNHLTSS